MLTFLWFTETFIEGRIGVRGVPVVPLRWLVDEILENEARYGFREIAVAVDLPGSTADC